MDFATRYRPQEFDEVIGQGHVIASLRELIEAESPPHAYAFTGPSGVGKTTLARIAARYLDCGIREIDAATYTGIDPWRQIRSNLGLVPLDGRNLAIIVDEAHSLSKAAWQSLLKDIEEPPAHVYWFLCTTEENKIPRTIQTRCVVYGLRSVSVDDLVDLMLGVKEQEKGGPPEKVVVVLAEEADGSPRQALQLLGQCWNVKKEKTAYAVLRKAGENSGESVQLARGLVSGSLSWATAMRLLSKIHEKPESVRCVVQSYAAKVAMGSKSEKSAMRAVAVIDAFNEPYISGGVGPLVLSIAELLLGGD